MKPNIIKQSALANKFTIKKVNQDGSTSVGQSAHSNSRTNRNDRYSLSNLRNTLHNYNQEMDLTTREEEKIELSSKKIILKKSQNLNIVKKTDELEAIEMEEEINGKQIQNVDDDEDDEFDEEGQLNTVFKKKYDLQDLQQVPAENNTQFYRILSYLLMKSKINDKNAFDIKIPVLNSLQKVDFSQFSSWKLFSSGLGDGAKIWGYKVDNTYGDTKKILGHLFRSDKDVLEKIFNKENKDEDNQKFKADYLENKRITINEDLIGIRTLTKRECLEGLSVDLYDLEFDKDPTFWRTSLNFDVKSAETMLLNKLPMDVDFGYVVDCEDKITLRVDKQLIEIEERQEFALNSKYPSLRQISQPFVILRKGQNKVPMTISMYEVIVRQVDELTPFERDDFILNFTDKIQEGVYNQLTSDQQNVDYQSLLEDNKTEMQNFNTRYEINRKLFFQDDDQRFSSIKPKVRVDFQTILETEGGISDQLAAFEKYVYSDEQPLYTEKKKRFIWNKFEYFNILNKPSDEKSQTIQNSNYQLQNQQINQDNQAPQRNVIEELVQIENQQQELMVEEILNQNIDPEAGKVQEGQQEVQNIEENIGKKLKIEFKNNDEILEIILDSDDNDQVFSEQQMEMNEEINNIGLKPNYLPEQYRPNDDPQIGSIAASQGESKENIEKQPHKAIRFHDDDSNSIFKNLLAQQKQKSSEQKLKLIGNTNDKQQLDISDMNIEGENQIGNDRVEGNQRGLDEVYISLGDEAWLREQEIMEEREEQEQGEEEVEEEDDKIKSNQNVQQNGMKLNQSQEKLQNSNKKNKENNFIQHVIPPPVIMNKDKQQKNKQNQNKDEFSYKRFDQEQTKQSQSQDNNQNLNYTQYKPNFKGNQLNYQDNIWNQDSHKIEKQCNFYENQNEVIDFNILDDYSYHGDMCGMLPEQNNINPKKVYLQNITSMQERNDHIQDDSQIDLKKNFIATKLNDIQYNSKALAQFFGDDLDEEENERNQEQEIEIYMSEDEEDNDVNKAKSNQKQNNSKQNTNPNNNRKQNEDSDSDKEVQIIYQRKVNTDKTFDGMHIGYVNQFFQPKKYKLISNNSNNNGDDLVIKLDDEADIDLNIFEKTNPFLKSRFQNVDENDHSGNDISSCEDICEQFLGQDYKKKKQMKEKEQFLENYNKLFEEKLERMLCERQQQVLPKQQKQELSQPNLKNEKQQLDIQSQLTDSKDCFVRIDNKIGDSQLTNTVKKVDLDNRINKNKNVSDIVHQNHHQHPHPLAIQIERDEYADEDNSDVDIFGHYLLSFDKKKRGLYNYIRQKEDEIEEEFNKLLYSDDEDSDNIFLSKKDKHSKNAIHDNDNIQSKGIDFTLNNVHLIDLRENESENHPLYSIKRYLGDQFYQREEDILTEKEIKNLKYAWGYWSFPKADLNIENFTDSNKFDMKLFNVGKGTHRIDMRSGIKGSEYFKVKINDEEQEELQLIQTSKLSMAPKTKEDWEKKKVRIYGKRKNLNEIDFDIMNQEEDYQRVIQPRYRSMREIMQEKQKRKQRRRNVEVQNEEKLTNRQRYKRNIMKKREILYILQDEINYDALNQLHIVSSQYMHYLELPSLMHFVATKNIFDVFRTQKEAILDISVDEVQIDLSSNGDDDFLKAQFRLDEQEIDFNIFECGLYDALEVERPCFADIIQNIEHQQVENEQKVADLLMQNEVDQQQLQQTNIEHLEGNAIDQINEQLQSSFEIDIDIEEKKEENCPNQRNEILDKLYLEEDESILNNSKICSSSKQIKKQKKGEQKSIILNKILKRKQPKPIDVEQYSYQEQNDNDDDSYPIDQIEQKDQNSLQGDELYQPEINSFYQVTGVDEVSSFGIELDDYSVVEYDESSSQQFIIYNHEQESEAQSKMDRSLNNSFSKSSSQSLETESQHFSKKKIDWLKNITLSKKLQRYDKKLRKQFTKKNEVKECKQKNISDKILEDSAFDIINEDVEQEDIHSNNSIDEQYNHSEFLYLRPSAIENISIQQHETHQQESQPYREEEQEVEEQKDTSQQEEQQVIDEDKQVAAEENQAIDIGEQQQQQEEEQHKEQLQEQEEENERIRVVEEIELELEQEYYNQFKEYPYLQHVNDLDRFKNRKSFQPEIRSDFMGMSKKTSMKELIIKVWWFLKRKIKQKDQIQLDQIPFSFYDLLFAMPQIIGTEDAKKISMQTMLSILLHLSNLKDFNLISDNSGQNFYIIQDTKIDKEKQIEPQFQIKKKNFYVFQPS